MNIFQAQTNGLRPAVADNGDGTYSAKVYENTHAHHVHLTIFQAQTLGLKEAVVDNGDGTYSKKLATQ
jgi:hypothetical protein